MTQARDLAFKTLENIQSRFPALKEVTGEGGGPYLMIPTENNPEAGNCRIWQGGGLKLVYVGLENRMAARHIPGNPEIHVDSHMAFAFTDKASSVPHFTLDSIYTSAPGMPAPVLAFHLDMIPRVDLGANLDYMNKVYGGSVTEAQTEAKANEGFTPAALTSFQLAVMSPWMLANRATPEAFATIPMQTYFDRWADLVDSGIDADVTPGVDGDAFALRDRRNRAVLFSKEIDPVWDQIERGIGAAMGAKLREILIAQDHV